MTTAQESPVVWDDPPPRPHTGFESDVIAELEALVTSLPAGTARMLVSRLRADPSCLEPEFEITPRNSKAARIGGYAIVDDLWLDIGGFQIEFFRFARGGNLFSGAPWRDELLWIWEAAMAGRIAQRRYFNKRGRLIEASCKISVKGRDFTFRSERWERLFRRAYTRVETVTYEPYVPAVESGARTP